MQNANIGDAQDVRPVSANEAVPRLQAGSGQVANAQLKSAVQARRWNFLTLVIPILAILPLFSFQASRMWADPARAYFPLVLLFVGLVVGWQLKLSEPTRFAVRRWIAIFLFVLAAIVFLWSVWSFLPWWSQVAGLLAFAAWGLGNFGNLSSGVIGLWTACLGTSLTLPFGWEQGLPYVLRQTAAWCSSKTLDGLGLPHLWVGNLFELRGLVIVIDEVCGGWTSIYALLAVTICLMVLQRRSIFVTLLCLLLVPIWMVLAYYLKLLSITYAHELWGRDLASGWDFVLLDAASFVLAFSCSWLFSRTMAVLFEPVPVGDAEFGPLFASMNKLLCWPQPDPFEDVPPQDSDDLEHFHKLKREKQKLHEAKPKIAWWANLSARSIVVSASLCFVFAAILPVAVIATGAALPRFTRPVVTPSVATQLVNVELPKQTGDWELLESEAPIALVQRGGGYSIDWQYRSPSQAVLFQISFPYQGWSEPAANLQRRAWKVDQRSIEYRESNDSWPIYEAELENDLGGRVYLYASFLDDQRRPFEGLPDYAELEKSQLKQQNVLNILQGEKRLADQVTIQLRMVCETGEPLNRIQLDNLQEQFDALRIRFVQDAPAIGAETENEPAEMPPAA